MVSLLFIGCFNFQLSDEDFRESAKEIKNCARYKEASSDLFGRCFYRKGRSH